MANHLNEIAMKTHKIIDVILPEGTVVNAQGKIIPSKRSIQGWPRYKYLDVSFSQPTTIDFITFTNYYTCTVTVKWRPLTNDRGSENWNTCLENYVLMKNCHCELGSEDNIVLGPSELKGPMKEVVSLRMVMKQPSFAWKDYTIHDLKCYNIM